jgi:hypothetical protein
MVNKSYVHIFTMNKKKVSKILEINTEDEMSAVYRLCVFSKTLLFIRVPGREEKQNIWFHLLIIVIYKC